jgi:alpha-tubulin suppressor-like RCC1 family protein
LLTSVSGLTIDIVLSVAIAKWTCGQQFSLYADSADRAPLGVRKPLVLVHGLQLDQRDCFDLAAFDPATETFRNLATQIRQDPAIDSAYKLYFFRYPSWDSIIQTGNALGQALRSAGLSTYPNSVVLLGHSMGGLVSRQAMTDPLVAAAVERLITLATPHMGTPAADTAQINADLDQITSPIRTCYERQSAAPPWPFWTEIAPAILHLHGNAGLNDVWSGSDFMTKHAPPLSPTKVIALAGQIQLGSVNHGYDLFSILKTDGLLTVGCILERVDGETQHDGVVPVSSAAPTGLNSLDTVFIGLDHFDMTGNAVTPPQGLLDRVTALLHLGLASTLAKVSGDSQSAPISALLPQPIVVKVADGFGNGVRGILVTFSVDQGGGFLAVSGATDSLGMAQARWMLGPSTGTQTVTASAPGLEGSPTVFTATATPAVGFMSVSAGAYHTCGVTTDSLAYCWGDGSYGQIGNDSMQPFYRISTPVAVAGGHKFVAISAGADFTCAVTGAGSAYCWGSNGYGQLGDGSTTGRYHPVPVAGGHLFVAVSAGASGHACGVTTDSAAYCWGFGNVGQLGNGTTTVFSDTPVLVVGNHHFGQVDAGRDHSCGVASGGVTYCWGTNTFGELGDGLVHGMDSVPSPVGGGHTFIAVSAGGGHSCGITAGGPAGLAYCWGHNDWGQVGNGMFDAFEPVPAQVVGGVLFTSLSAGHDSHTCGIEAATAAALCWGNNSTGQLGNASIVPSSTPVTVIGGIRFVVVTAGIEHTCGVAESGLAFCWGENLVGQLGNGSTSPSDEPVPVVSPPVSALTSSIAHDARPR